MVPPDRFGQRFQEARRLGRVVAVLRKTRLIDLWFARTAIAAVIVLQIGMINNFSFGGRWLAPSLEVVLLIPLTILAIRNQRLAHHAATDAEWLEFERRRHGILVLGFTLVTIVSLANATALLGLVHALLSGRTQNGTALLIDAMNIWATNVIVFALWYWEIDRGGPSKHFATEPPPSDFIFPQSTLPPEHPAAPIPPGFIDYLFLSFTTSTAFSPTDTLPLTWRMKLLMMLEASVSLLTVALVAARAVNILA